MSTNYALSHNFALCEHGPYLPLIEGVERIVEQDKQFSVLPRESQEEIIGKVVQKAADMAMEWKKVAS